MCLLQGSNLTISCFYTRQYASSLKAWQRVRGSGPPETLVGTETRNTDENRAQAGRYLLEDDPTEHTFRITMRELQRQDLGLYQCVIDLSPQTPVVLPPRIRLVLCEGEQWQEPRQGKLWRLHSWDPSVSRGFGDGAQSHGKSSLSEIRAHGSSCLSLVT